MHLPWTWLRSSRKPCDKADKVRTIKVYDPDLYPPTTKQADASINPVRLAVKDAGAAYAHLEKSSRELGSQRMWPEPFGYVLVRPSGVDDWMWLRGRRTRIQSM
jgi:hypothetical protein